MEKPNLIRDLTSDKWNYHIRNYLNNNLNSNEIFYIESVYLKNGNIIRYYIKIKDNIWYKSIKYYDENDILLKVVLERINLDFFYKKSEILY